MKHIIEPVDNDKYIYKFTELHPEAQLIVIGDVHGQMDDLETEIHRYSLKHALYIVLGDCGFMNMEQVERMEYKYTLDRLREFLREMDSYLLFGRGNHDNPDYFHVGQRPALFHDHINIIPDNTIIQFGDNNILWIGGAVSIDRTSREEGYSWFRKEVPSWNFPYYRQLQKEYRPTIILSHGLPAVAPPFGSNSLLEHYFAQDKRLKAALKTERANYDKILHIFEDCVKWYSGHYHTDAGAVWTRPNGEDIVNFYNIRPLEFREVYFERG